jgi:hypothetical protein
LDAGIILPGFNLVLEERVAGFARMRLVFAFATDLECAFGA